MPGGGKARRDHPATGPADRKRARGQQRPEHPNARAAPTAARLARAAAVTGSGYSGGSWSNIPSGARTKTIGQASRPSAHSTSPERSSLAASSKRDRFLRAAPQRLDRALAALGIDHDVKVYPDAGHAFLHQSGNEPGKVVAILARITHAGYHEPSA